MGYLKCPILCLQLDVGSEVGSFFHQHCFQKVVMKCKCDYLGRIEQSKRIGGFGDGMLSGLFVTDQLWEVQVEADALVGVLLQVYWALWLCLPVAADSDTCVLHEPSVGDIAHCLSCPEASSHCVVVLVWVCYSQLFYVVKMCYN